MAREKTTAAIVEEGRRQLAEHGAAGLSLRSVARELGLVSSNIYRYVASRDDLLTRLIIEAYDSLGEAVEDAVVASKDEAPLDRWVGAAHAVRDWALDHSHEYFLLYGTPVPGYAAPELTGESGTRVARALVAIAADAANRKQLSRPRRPAPEVSDHLVADFATLRTNIDDGERLDDRLLLTILAGWTQLFGLVSFELSNQTRGLVAHHRDLFDATSRLMAANIGLSEKG